MSIITTLRDALSRLSDLPALSCIVYHEEGSPLVHRSRTCVRRPRAMYVSELSLVDPISPNWCPRCEDSLADVQVQLQTNVLARRDTELLCTAAGVLECCDELSDAGPEDLADLGNLLGSLRIELEKLEDTSCELVAELVALARAEAHDVYADRAVELQDVRAAVCRRAHEELAALRGWDDCFEVETEEVLIAVAAEYSYGAAGTSSESRYGGATCFAEVMYATFALAPLPGALHYVLRAPRFVADLLRESTEEPVCTAQLPSIPTAVALAASLWDPAARDEHASLPACVRLATELLSVAA